MEPETLTLSSPCTDLHPLPMDFDETNTELCEESVTYSELTVRCSSNIQKKKRTRILTTKVSPWCLAAVVFAFLYFIVLIIAAVMTAKVHCLEKILKKNETGHCKII
ncbi:uncharacterized protein LOC141570139 [Rhinolophus sinicus]|uniref:uncharacterized protein LOC141570139 n=1 Tax=Rhinolophus sinicus TaxID=89399 RepID=UPI003D7B567E